MLMQKRGAFLCNIYDVYLVAGGVIHKCKIVIDSFVSVASTTRYKKEDNFGKTSLYQIIIIHLSLFYKNTNKNYLHMVKPSLHETPLTIFIQKPIIKIISLL